jgi:thioredoxin reductase (NADPH)
MSQILESRYFFNSLQHPLPPATLKGEWIDLARDPSSAHVLLRLGVSPRADLPALLQAEPNGKLRVLGLRLAAWEAERLAAGHGARPPREVRVYGAGWCPDCRRARRFLEESAVAFDEVNVDESVEAETLVLARSGGRRVIPTLLLDERIWAFNPDPPLLKSLVLAAPPPPLAA